MKKFIPTLLIGLLIFLVSSISLWLVYYFIYPVANSNYAIQKSITSYETNPKSKNVKIEVVLDIGSEKFVLVQNDNELQYATFAKGLNGRLKYLSTANLSKTNTFVQNINNTNYLLIIGVNKLQNSKLKVSVITDDNVTAIHTLDISKDNYFIKCMVLSNSPPDTINYRVFSSVE